MRTNKGVIYILTNPSFKEYVKIGYADNVESRLKQLNNSECIPFAFRIYATYEVEERLTDLKLHALIDQLNPNLRSSAMMLKCLRRTQRPLTCLVPQNTVTIDTVVMIMWRSYILRMFQ